MAGPHHKGMLALLGLACGRGRGEYLLQPATTARNQPQSAHCRAPGGIDRGGDAGRIRSRHRHFCAARRCAGAALADDAAIYSCLLFPAAVRSGAAAVA